MGDPNYESRRRMEQAEHDRRCAEAKAGADFARAMSDFLTGASSIDVTPLGEGWSIRLRRGP